MIPIATFFIFLFVGQHFASQLSPAVFSISAVLSLFLFISVVAFYFGRKGGVRARIFSIFIGYLAVIFVFGVIYLREYKENPSCFNFSGNIEQTKYLEVFDDYYPKLIQINDKLFLLRMLESKPEIGVNALNNKGEKQTIDSGYTVKYDIAVNPFAPSIVYFSIVGPNRKADFDTANLIDPITPLVGGLTHGAKNTDVFSHQLSLLIKKLEQERNEIINFMNTSKVQNAGWDYLDFVYFSAVTMTTLGYGDITPNSRNIRMLVMFQTIFGITYFAFGLGLLWPLRENQIINVE